MTSPLTLLPPTAPAHRPRPQPGTELTDRELQVLDLASRGRTNRVIGDRLHITENTVKAHMRKLLVRLSAHDRAHAVRQGFRLGLLTVDEETPS